MRNILYYIITMIFIILMCSGCEGEICISIKNNSTDTIWCYTGHSHSECCNTILSYDWDRTDKRGGIPSIVAPGDSSQNFEYFVGFGNFNFKAFIETLGPIHIFVFKKDTINVYGETDALKNHRYEVEYVFYSHKVIEATGRLAGCGEVAFPPTQKMIDAGVAIYYPDDTPDFPEYR